MKVRKTARICFSALLLMLCACRTVDSSSLASSVHVSSNVTERIVRDSVFVRDSIFIREKADTVYFTKYRTLYKEHLRHDTLLVRDTVYSDRVVTKVVEKKALGLRQMLLAVLCLLLCCAIALLLWRRLRRRSQFTANKLPAAEEPSATEQDYLREVL